MTSPLDFARAARVRSSLFRFPVWKDPWIFVLDGPATADQRDRGRRSERAISRGLSGIGDGYGEDADEPQAGALVADGRLHGAPPPLGREPRAGERRGVPLPVHGAPRL